MIKIYQFIYTTGGIFVRSMTPYTVHTTAVQVIKLGRTEEIIKPLILSNRRKKYLIHCTFYYLLWYSNSLTLPLLKANFWQFRRTIKISQWYNRLWDKVFMSKACVPGQSRPYRLVVVGASGVGKTAIIEHLIYGNHVVGKVEFNN